MAMLYFLLFSLFTTTLLYSESNILQLDLEDLSTIEIKNTAATLTQAEQKEIPASTTIITHKEILESGARTLDELLEIYVPSFAYMKKVHGSQIGMRGIISDRNNKILLLVNNRVMNVKMSDGGAITERWFSMLDDIKKITVIEGSGSAIYGSGAIAGVISIETFSGKDREGLHFGTKVGFEESFYNFELSYGEKLDSDLYMYIYYGVDSYRGASGDEAANKFAFSMDGKYENWHQDADKNFLFKTTNDNGSLEEKLRHKLHFQLDSDNFTFWFRVTKSSLATATDQGLYQHTTEFNREKIENTGSQNQQITVFGEYKSRISRNIDIKYDLSYMRSDVFINFYGDEFVAGDKSWGEDNFMGKVLLNYEINSKNQLAIGSEYNYNKFGRESDIGNAPYSKVSALDPGVKWNSDSISLFGEYQARFRDNLTMFAGVRIDKHKFSPWIYSPRVNFVYSVTRNDIVKFGFNRSLRYTDEADMYAHLKRQGSQSDVESIDTLELIYTKYRKKLRLNLSLFANSHNIVAFNGTTKLTESLGKADSVGATVSLDYRYKKVDFSLSHSYTKLIDFQLDNPNILLQNISASVNGYGDDFANWNNHITKLRCNYKVTRDLKWVNSLRVFWGMPGAEDMANYNIDLNNPLIKYRLPLYDNSDTKAFSESLYFNSSFVWSIDKKTTLTLNGYNILGLFDEDLNKRNFFQQSSHYRDAAPSLSIGLRHKF